MILILQRCSKANVSVSSSIIGSINKGLVVLIGVEKEDDEKIVNRLVEKTINLRIFNDSENRMNKSIIDIKGSILVISQFTLCGDLRKGRRPSYIKTANPKLAKLLYNCFINKVLDEGVPVESGKFGAEMSVSLINEGPATFYLNSSEL
ncbi:MAG: D-tyrosyl-tRNA(Tyr) deacylase [Candidatus Marinimicrobia bacterium]|nr:D-tyrosyl-tRNA(Tyr) deacylase [Candidatus Neomarinimicrobiota bacterium]|tara:strand:- start:4424 stop:4870 length:447 start_codon:yes stop_codon:yes gene_type:complete